MRGRGGDSDREFPIYPIVPVLVSFGGASVPDGLGWRAYRCPFHKDSDASGSINTTLQVYNCHAADCPKGNAVQVLMQHEGLTYAEAVERAETISGESVGDLRSGTGRRGRVAGRARNRAGTRAFKRTWRSD